MSQPRRATDRLHAAAMARELLALLSVGVFVALSVAQDAPTRMPAIDATIPAATYPAETPWSTPPQERSPRRDLRVPTGLPDWSPPPPLDETAPPGYVLPPVPLPPAAIVPGASALLAKAPADPANPPFDPQPGTLHQEIEQPSPSDRPGVPPGHPIDFKPGSFFQKLTFTSSWMERGDGPEAIGVVDGELFLTVALPFPTTDFPILITPGFAIHAWDGPIANEMPPRTYDAYVDFSWVARFSDTLTAVLGVSPGYYGDFHNFTSDGLRIKGKGIVKWDWFPDRLSLIGGVYYLDRPDFPFLPVGGAIYCPNDDWRLEFIFPRPKFGYRLTWDGRREDWVYVMGEFGGDSWAIQRTDLSYDRAAYRDWRLILGVERNLPGGAHRRFEVAWLFNRHLEYNSGSPEVTPGDTILVRAGISF